jgi:hypothetical protein
MATINGADIKKRSIAGKKLKKNSGSDKEVAERGLARVPLAAQAQQAALAADADQLDGRDSESFELTCPEGTTRLLGVCFETTLRPAATASAASRTCGEQQRRLPTFAELEGARQNGLTTGVGGNYELSGTIYEHDTNETQVLGIDQGGNRLGGAYASFSQQFRWVALPDNAG